MDLSIVFSKRLPEGKPPFSYGFPMFSEGNILLNTVEKIHSSATPKPNTPQFGCPEPVPWLEGPEGPEGPEGHSTCLLGVALFLRDALILSRQAGGVFSDQIPGKSFKKSPNMFRELFKMSWGCLVSSLLHCAIGWPMAGHRFTSC